MEGSREPYPGPEPFHRYRKHVGQSFEALGDWDTVAAVVGAVPLGTLSYLGLTKVVWRITHAKKPPAE